MAQGMAAFERLLCKYISRGFFLAVSLDFAIYM